MVSYGNKKAYFVCYCCVFFFASCNSKTEKSDSTAEISTESNDKGGLKRIEKSGGSFYGWYFKNGFRDWDVVKGKDGYCLLDTVSYFKRLRSFGAISEEFIKSERERLQGCAEFIATIEYDVYGNTEGDEYYKYCSFLYYKDWFMSQDPFDRLTLKK
ncbi:hypothetical protein [Flavobacterium cerinum]|uniref:Lipoprotein n=1 Tax=Flavobacterium cerinum TaxID=2502784 RepID=A0ABY5IZ03_9FLAO|nr:hypothetical protein [Flavobacterium cerinum]UUC46564.1 hypothetical protein NOX80_05025 [Flavobacterium cerinum]